jgi:uncharacterized membrane protein
MSSYIPLVGFSAAVGNEYNTLMALAAGVTLLLIIDLGRRLLTGSSIYPAGWVAAFVALGSIMAFLGAVMTVTWPLKEVAPNCCEQDNIVFGEPILAFGVITLAASYLLWRTSASWSRAAIGHSAENGVKDVAGDEFVDRFALALQPLSLFVFAAGLALLALAVAGVRFKLYAAPPSEPISGVASGHPYIEAIFISTLYGLMGVGAVLFPVFVRTLGRGVAKTIAIVWLIPGVVWLLFASMNYYTHVGSLVQHSGRF